MYYLFYFLIYLLSILPMRALYLFSDALFILVYYLLGYRKSVVLANLSIAFPEKTDRERIKIAKRFYHNFIDSYIEMVKLLTASEDFIKEHFSVDNPQVYESIFEEGRKCQILLGHTLNWEYANLAMPLCTRFRFMVAYMPLSHKAFDRLLLRLRGRTGTILLPANRLGKSLIPYRKTLYMLTLVADQAPSDPPHSFWLRFFGRPTPFLRGPERGARIADVPVLFCNFYKTKRGYYRAKLEMGSEHPSQLQVGELTLRYTHFLERVIREDPSLYLWSHRRWKYPWKEEYEKMWIDQAETIPLTLAD
jgi:Kdo2-lipid IVA lauroyltransferase/acyltransferase